MENKKKIVAIATTTLMSAVALTVLLAGNKNSIFSIMAAPLTNEYGCRDNCTGEYEIRHVKEILQNSTTKGNTDNVRLLVKVSKYAYGIQWFQDINDDTEFKSISNVNGQSIEEHLMYTTGLSQGYDINWFKQGDIVGVVGTINWVKSGFGGYTLEVSNPIFYQWNDKLDLSLLPPVNYIQ